MKKSLALAIILALLCSLLPVAVIASPLPRGWDDGIMPMYVAFSNTYCQITVSGTTATCAAGGGGSSTKIDYVTVDMSLWSGPIGSTTYPTEVNTWPTYTSAASSGGILSFLYALMVAINCVQFQGLSVDRYHQGVQE